MAIEGLFEPAPSTMAPGLETVSGLDVSTPEPITTASSALALVARPNARARFLLTEASCPIATLPARLFAPLWMTIEALLEPDPKTTASALPANF